MLKIHALGHVHITQNTQAVALSSKATALLTYLALEKHAYHREQLAELLWDHPQALRNLRVELTRLKQQGIDAFPPRQPMLSLRCETDLDGLLRELPQLDDRQLPLWLAQLRGAPLSGLEDLGSADFRSWVDQRRSAINEQVEDLLGELHQRYEQRGQDHLCAQVQERAGRLGLRLPNNLPCPEAVGEDIFHYPAQSQKLKDLLLRAHRLPQLVFLHGMSGSKHALINQAARGTPWQVIHLQGAPHRKLVQAALLQQLHQMQQGLAGHNSEALQFSDDQDGDLIRAMQFLSQAKQPVVLALHNLSSTQDWLVNGIRFALDLRIPLVIILSSSSSRVLNELRLSMSHMDWSRQHELHLPALGPQGVLSSALGLPVATGPGQEDAAYRRAATLAQHADGWPLHIRLLAKPDSAPNGPHVHLRQSETVTQATLSSLAPLSRQVTQGLQRLAMLVDRFDPALAQVVLADQTASVLQAAQAAKVLLPVSAVEHVQFPTLESRTTDAEPHLAFHNETLRIALARQLSSAERHQLRCQLARHYLHTQPALSAYYADRAQLTELAAQARAQLPARLPAEVRLPPALLVSAPPPQALPRQEQRTANGYRVALENGRLEILRLGRSGPAPKLVLHFPEVPPGPWRMTARLDVFDGELPGQNEADYALSLALSGVPRAVYTTQPVALPECPEQPCLGLIPSGRWFQIGGNAPGGSLQLSTRATNLALTIGVFSWNGQVLIPPYTNPQA